MRPTLLIIAALVQDIGGLKLFNFTEQLPASMSDECKNALTSDINNCSPRLIKPGEVTTRLPSNKDDLEQYCNDACVGSIKDWAQSIHDCCGDNLFDFGYSAVLGGLPYNQSASAMADALVWAQDVACLKEEGTGNFCGPILTNGTWEKCGDCTLKYMAGMLSSWYGSGPAPSKKGFDRLLEECCVDPAKYPVANWTAPELPLRTDVRNITCFGGCYYTVKEGDTCQSIAYGFGVSYDRFLYQNGFDWNCWGLKPGREVCVGNPCSLYIVQENDTCESITSNYKFTLTEFHAWNPTIHGNCDNLGAMKGRTVCVSPPGADTYDVNITVSWGQWTTPNWGSWTAAPTRADGLPPTPVLELRDLIPTATYVYNATIERRRAEVIDRHCPVTREDLERGFDWHHLSRGCYELLKPYCHPSGEEPVPTGLPEVPKECLPAVVMGWAASM